MTVGFRLRHFSLNILCLATEAHAFRNHVILVNTDHIND